MMRKVDVLIVGAGPAGIAAATTAAKHGRKVLLLDDNASAGGQIWRDGISSRHSEIDTKKSSAIAALCSSGAEILMGRRVIDAPQQGVLRAAIENSSANTVETYAWSHLVIATGARERFIPFPGWTLPGIFGAGGLQTLVKGGFNVKGKRVVVAGTGPLLLAVAAHLRKYGATVVCIAEQASWSQILPFAASLCSQPTKLLQGAQYRIELSGIPYRSGCWPIEATGETSLRSIRLSNGRRTWEEPCDLLACGFHLVPNTELALLLGCALEGDFIRVDEQQRTSIENVFCVGEPTGIAGLAAALVQGKIAGLAISGQTEQVAALQGQRVRECLFGKRLEKAFRLRSELQSLATPETTVCRCEDVRYNQLKEQPSWADAKLQTRCGMGPCQGRICGPATQSLFGWRSNSVRPPIFPISLDLLRNDDHVLFNEATAPQEKL
jgi:Pyruvate/2-oxoglutarate dehydrogenase complex, dihydrolipoamide dehydrogenase (E3) component, and related enzymes